MTEKLERLACALLFPLLFIFRSCWCFSPWCASLCTCVFCIYLCSAYIRDTIIPLTTIYNMHWMNLGSIKPTLHPKIKSASSFLWPVMLFIHLDYFGVCLLFNVPELTFSWFVVLRVPESIWKAQQECVLERQWKPRKPYCILNRTATSNCIIMWKEVCVMRCFVNAFLSFFIFCCFDQH